MDKSGPFTITGIACNDVFDDMAPTYQKYKSQLPQFEVILKAKTTKGSAREHEAATKLD